MNVANLQMTIDQAWEERNTISPETTGKVKDAIEEALNGLDIGTYRVAKKSEKGWEVAQWLKKAVLLSFRLYDNTSMPGGPKDPRRGDTPWYDKISPKFSYGHFFYAPYPYPFLV